MRLQTSSPSTTPSSPLSLASLSALFLSLPALVSANLDCHDIAAKGKHYDLSRLGGPHQVHWRRQASPVLELNTTFTIDICHKLKWTKGGKPEEECPHGTRICGIERREISANETEFLAAIPIAGDYTLGAGRTINAQWELLRDSNSNHDTNRDGIRGTLHGGKYPFNKNGIDQQAIVEFICDPDRTGLEGDEKDDSDKEDDDDDDDKAKRDEGEEGGDDKKNPSLKFLSYEEEEQEKGKKVGVLRLEWRTKEACEGAKDKDPGSSSGWGFFTWFIIILFLAIATYLIFGSWLNYNRYGARGWDLLPHGDTIRDVPYILKDWARRVANTLQGPGSRGGYSAV